MSIPISNENNQEIIIPIVVEENDCSADSKQFLQLLPKYIFKINLFSNYIILFIMIIILALHYQILLPEQITRSLESLFQFYIIRVSDTLFALVEFISYSYNNLPKIDQNKSHPIYQIVSCFFEDFIRIHNSIFFN